MNKEPGYVYILTNPSFREDWVKIGKSARPVDIRSKELDNTAVPLPFEIFATMKTAKYDDVEKLVHKNIDRLTDLRIRQNREFFNVAPQVALDIFRDIARVIDDAVVTEYENNKPVILKEEPHEDKPTRTTRRGRSIAKDETHEEKPTRAARRGRFKFSMVGINIGEYVQFDPTGVTVRVATDDTVEYENRLYKLSSFVGTFMPEDRRTPSGAYQGSMYFSYKGKTLEKLRKALENNTF